MPTCSYEGCGREVYRGSEKCIFHTERKAPQEFRAAMTEETGLWDRQGRSWDFTGWVFVADESEGPPRMRKFVRFYGWRCTKDVSFAKAKFLADANFNKAELKGKADFREAEFHHGAWFENATFGRSAQFERAVFKSVSFKYATFHEEAAFRGAILKSDVDLSYTFFERVGDFSHARVAGHVKLVWPGAGQTYDEKGNAYPPGTVVLDDIQFPKLDDGSHGRLDLRNNALRDGANLLLCNTNMSRVLVEGTDCRLIKFKNAEWPEYKEKRHAARRIVADEYFLRECPSVLGEGVPSWDSIAVTYQQLVARYRKDLDHPVANDFERGIFEARLESAKVKGLWQYRLLLGTYKLLSDFSGSILRPIWWTLLLTAICGFFYGHLLYAGHWAWPWHTELPLVCKSAATALRIVTLDRGLIIREIGDSDGNEARLFWVSLVAAIQIIITAILITLLVFSVRRRFKHTE
jgi:uncharacterized protein YjbI with pentapeptide repeats